MIFAIATAEGVAFIGAGATVAAAVILGAWAAWAADRRQERQIEDSGRRQEREIDDAAVRQAAALAAESDRQAKALAAEAERQAAALAHERELADLADLRALLDKAAVSLNEARDARDDVMVSFSQHGLNLPDDPIDRLKDCGNEIFRLLVRLHIRLGAEHKITIAFQDASQALLDTWRAVRDIDKDALAVKEARDEIRRAAAVFTRSYNAFFSAATARAGTVALEPPPLMPG